MFNEFDAPLTDGIESGGEGLQRALCFSAPVERGVMRMSIGSKSLNLRKKAGLIFLN